MCLVDAPQSNIASATTLVSGLKEDLLSKGVTIYPNPSQGNLTFSIEHQESGTVHLALFNILGSKLIEKEIRKDHYSVESQLDLTALPDGIYSIQVILNDVKITKRLIKQ